MAILKSAIIGKTVRDIVPTFIDKVSHKTWRKLPTSTINLLSRCILRYANSYGATYQISQNKELTIVSNKGQYYLLESYTKFLDLIIVDYQNPSEDKPMNTQPTPTDIKVGTHWERLKKYADFPAGEIVTLTKVTEIYISYSDGRGKSIEDFLKTFKPRPDLDNPPVKSKPVAQSEPALPFSIGDTFIHPDYGEVTITAIDLDVPYPVRYDGPNCTGEYSVDKIDVVEEFIKQSKPVASKKEANPKPTKNENTFMSKIKASASATVDQNKQALVIASKMEAGRIINKQVLKQLTPHLPFFLQGYAKSPFAPFVAANLVAMVANHTGNSKLTKVSDLMLLGAADSGVAAFNLDKIVDDILSNIKLPAGILDDSEE